MRAKYFQTNDLTIKYKKIKDFVAFDSQCVDLPHTQRMPNSKKIICKLRGAKQHVFGGR